MDKRADSLEIGDVVSVTGRRSDASAIISTERKGTPHGDRIIVETESGSFGQFPPRDKIKVYDE